SIWLTPLLATELFPHRLHLSRTGVGRSLRASYLDYLCLASRPMPSEPSNDGGECEYLMVDLTRLTASGSLPVPPPRLLPRLDPGRGLVRCRGLSGSSVCPSFGGDKKSGRRQVSAPGAGRCQVVVVG